MKQKCDKCDRPATVHLTEIVEGEKTEKHLCEVCAASEGITVQPSIPISQLLEDFVMQSQQAKQLGDLVCDQCGMTFLEFRQHGLLGCSHDYEAFGEALEPLLARAQEGAVSHVGKVPSRAGGDEVRQNRLLQMRSDLQKAIRAEAYEEAARLRDQIQALEGS
ncbi:MAG: UvrB/UvrC motif-containing protein [Planctomycetota bacterium]